ncbi:DUF5615 family PIN-like protein [Gordonia polyisoprenivorans]|uniref:DUF5615 family PIN-like protein n=1 Tax=Gordonia polyisoprenivorans TaxID=84595 RepID=UPI002300321E|nr:DUF5615 family PIN-like protein [Gordonia polyisoprenivorans]WCB38999.1 DUF5615 family PIN-like protein [Gordonia polyisoprenivorans]
MRFLVDAQLPARLADLLNRAGHEAIHSSDLDDGNRTTDQEICRRADLEHRTVITKDRDFRDTHLLSGTPRSVLIVATGNISNHDLLDLFTRHLETIVEVLTTSDFGELSRRAVIAHHRRGS